MSKKMLASNLRLVFERVINEKQRLYNLVRKDDDSYFSLHTQRAWETFQLGFRAAGCWELVDG
jgi:hypothetical protein